jgi:hypothetical protein
MQKEILVDGQTRDCLAGESSKGFTASATGCFIKLLDPVGSCAHESEVSLYALRLLRRFTLTTGSKSLSSARFPLTENPLSLALTLFGAE